MTVKWTEWGEGSHTKGAGKSKERAGSFCFLFTMDKPGGTKIKKKLKIKMLKMDTSKCECTLGSSRLSPGVAESRQEMDSLYGCRKGTGADSVTGGGHQEELQHHVEIHPPPHPVCTQNAQGLGLDCLEDGEERGALGQELVFSAGLMEFSKQLKSTGNLGFQH